MFNHLIQGKAIEIVANLIVDKKKEALKYIEANKDKLVEQVEVKIKAAFSTYVAEHKDEIFEYIKTEVIKMVKSKMPKSDK